MITITVRMLNSLDSESLFCKGDLAEKELCDTTKNMPNKKSEGNNGLTK